MINFFDFFRAKTFWLKQVEYKPVAEIDFTSTIKSGAYENNPPAKKLRENQHMMKLLLFMKT